MQRSSGRRAVSRNAVRAVCAVALFLAGMVAPGDARADVLGNVKIAVESHPTTITEGNKVIYRVTLTHEGVTAGVEPLVDIRVTSTLTGGHFTGQLPGVPCQEGSGTATCTVVVKGPLVAGGSVSFDLVGAGLPVGKTEIASKIGTFLVGNDPSDDTARASTVVISGTDSACTYHGYQLDGATGCKAGFFPAGSTITFGAQTLKVPLDSNGVIGELAEVGSDSGFCQTHTCRYGLGVLENFYPVPGFEVTNPKDPLQTFITSRKGDPCRGLGNGADCLALLTLRYETEPPGGWQSPEIDPEIPLCIGSNEIPTGKVCIADRSRTTAAGVRFTVLLLSDDPGMY